jgi:hypothetical protein
MQSWAGVDIKAVDNILSRHWLVASYLSLAILSL